MAYVTEERTIVPLAYHSPAITMLRRVVYFVLNVVELLLALRLLFRAFAANPAAGFIQFVYSLTDPLVRPFFGIFANARSGNMTIEWATIMAMIVYAMVAALFLQLVRVLTPPRGGV